MCLLWFLAPRVQSIMSAIFKLTFVSLKMISILSIIITVHCTKNTLLWFTCINVLRLKLVAFTNEVFFLRQSSLLTGHPVGGKVMIDDLILQINGGHVLRVGHSNGQQDAHQKVDNLSGMEEVFFIECIVFYNEYKSSISKTGEKTSHSTAFFHFFLHCFNSVCFNNCNWLCYLEGSWKKNTKYVVIVDRPFGFNGIHCNNFKEDKLENKKTAGGKVLVRFQCLLFELIFCIPVTLCTGRGKTTSVHTGYFVFYVAITS